MTTYENKSNIQKVVLITGASSGIGEATARLLARKGLQVVLGARRTDRLETLVSEIRAEGGSAEYRTLDVTDLEEMQAFVGFAKEKFGRIDVIVNNAGVIPLSKLEMLKIDEWNRMIDVNIRGVLHGIAASLPVMQQGSGQIILTCLRLVDMLSAPLLRFIVDKVRSRRDLGWFALGRHIAFVDTSPEAMYDTLLNVGFPIWEADGLLEEYAHYRRNEAAAVTSGVHDAIGKAPRNFEAFARDYAPMFS